MHFYLDANHQKDLDLVYDMPHSHVPQVLQSHMSDFKTQNTSESTFCQIVCSLFVEPNMNYVIDLKVPVNICYLPAGRSVW